MKKALVTLMVVLFTTVVIGQTKTEIKPAALPKCALDWLQKNMPGFAFDKAYKLEKKVGDKIVTSHYGRAVRENDKQWLFFDKDCVLVKKVSEREVMTDPPKPVPPVKPPVKDDKETPADPGK